MRLLAGRYRLIEPVGQGGMAVVWRAEDELLHRTVAVKLLAPQLSSDPASRRLIRAEAYAAAALNHPNIANLYDYGEVRSRGYRRVPFLVMEFVHGETLAARLHTGGALDWPRAVRIAADVAHALAAAHAAGLVHRDVKPGNVLLSPTGVKLVDLGIAVAVGARPVSEHGGVLGTPRYMAPEQVGGDPAVPASDVYALGLLLYECLTGEPLRKGTSVAELLTGEQLAPVTPKLDVPGLPEPVNRLYRRCLSAEPGDRPTSAWVAAVLAGVSVAGVSVARPSAAIVAASRPAGGSSGTTGPTTDDGTAAAAPTASTRAPGMTRRTAPPGRPTGSVPRPTRRPDAGGAPGRRRAARRGLLLAAAPVAVLAAVLTAQLPGLTSTDDPAEGAGTPAAAQCTARYTTHRAPDGTFTADLAVTNTGPQAPTDWVVSFTLPAGQRLTSDSGDLAWEPANRTVTIDLGADGSGSGNHAGPGTATVGLRGTYDITAQGWPSEFALNGQPCRQAATSITSTTAAPTSPSQDTVDDRSTVKAEPTSDPTPTADGPGEEPVPGGDGTAQPTPDRPGVGASPTAHPTRSPGTTSPQPPPADDETSQPPADPDNPEAAEPTDGATAPTDSGDDPA